MSKPTRYLAAIFDLDGVITRTASLHALAWKELFHEMGQGETPSFSLG